jgi:hypothetical protein
MLMAPRDIDARARQYDSAVQAAGDLASRTSRAERCRLAAVP